MNPSAASRQLFADFSITNYSSVRRLREQEIAQSNNTNKAAQIQSQLQVQNGLKLIGDLFMVATQSINSEFLSAFTFGKELNIWRKGRVKAATFFLDQNLPNFLWVSSLTKSFLIDLTHSTLDRYDYQLQQSSGAKNYIILHYFDQQIPILFEDQSKGEADHFYYLFDRYIQSLKLKAPHPPYFSKIMKLYTIQDVKDNISRKNNVKEILQITLALNLGQPKYTSNILESVWMQKSNKKMTQETELDKQDMSDYFKILYCNNSLRSIFQSYSGVNLKNYSQFLKPHLSPKDFTRFLQTEQGQTQSYIATVLQSIQRPLSFYDFCAFLENDTINHAAYQEQFDQNLPLTDYFCYSSHNTYLTGNQLTSDSKVERYLQDLQRGIKCVELDVHNGKDNMPMITHAFKDKSFSASIPFDETIKQIAKFCDQNPNHYPIILSIENHANEQNRYKMTNILSKYLGKRIFHLFEEHMYEHPTVCKTLAEMKGKVIIKSDSKLSELLSFLQKPQDKKSSIIFENLSTVSNFPSAEFNKRFVRFNKFAETMKKRQQLFNYSIPNSLFLPIAQMTKLTSLFKSPEGVNNPASVGYECTSLTNEKAQKIPFMQIVSYTNRSWLRIYPVGTEIGSANYNPVPLLTIGAQIIALNTQTKDKFALILMSYFSAGRTSQAQRLGYVPKPSYLRSGAPRPRIQKSYSIKILSDRPVKIAFHGSVADIKANQKKEQTYKVRDYDEGFLIFSIDQNLRECLPLRFVKRGYRVLVAKNEMFRDSGIRVLVHIDIKQQNY